MIYPLIKILFQMPLWFFIPSTLYKEMHKEMHKKMHKMNIHEERNTPIELVAGLDLFTD